MNCADSRWTYSQLQWWVSHLEKAWPRLVTQSVNIILFVDVPASRVHDMATYLNANILLVIRLIAEFENLISVSIPAGSCARGCLHRSIDIPDCSIHRLQT